MLEAAVGVNVGGFALDVELRADPGATVAVLGPNGAGKTTLLRALAGLVPLRAGRVRLGGQVLDDPSTGEYLPPERRPVGVVFQGQLLFPHLSALDNVAFGLGGRRGRRQALAWLERVGLADRAGARPHQLSGGQAQRVALARALATEPALLLLDEPLAGLDLSSRSEVRRVLRRQLAAFSGVRVLVTHDPVEASALADVLVVIEQGRVVQAGTHQQLTARPRSPYVAAMVGTNLLRGTAVGDRVVLDGDARLAIATPAEGPVLALVHPRAVALSRRQPTEGSPRNVWAGNIDLLEPIGERVRVRVQAPVPIVAEITDRAARDLALREGDRVWVSVKATEVDVFTA